MTGTPLFRALEPVAPAEAGFDPDRLAEAVAYARAHESAMDRDIGRALSTHFSEPLPDGEIIGPTRRRGDPNGMIVRGGRAAAAWGPTEAADMTFSVAKSYLAICAGLAWDDGLVPDLDAPARARVPDLFDAPRTAASPGATCCSRRASGRARSGARPTGSTATAASTRRLARPRARARIASSRARAGSGSTTTSASTCSPML
jgi:hypothetical protein